MPVVDLKGFLVTRPVEDGWQVASQTPDQLVQGKAGDFSGETLIFQATVVALPAMASGKELLRYAESTLRRDLDSARFRIIQVDTRPVDIRGQGCAMSHMEGAERSTGEGTASPVNVLIETLTLTCPHPQKPTHGISSVYSHRHLPEDRNPAFLQVGTAFLSTLEFGTP
ncbi:MAG: hypothetical protein ACKVP2_09110 [Burkholderiales bacterium]